MDYGKSGSGYMNTSFDGSNKTSSGFTRKPMGEQTLRPLTVKQIKGCSIPQDDLYRIDEADVTQVTIVGVIRSVQELATNYIYMVEDGTGAIEVKKWVEQSETPEESEARRLLLPDTYVRVNGRLNSFSGRISVSGHFIRPITDFNEVTYHFLDTIYIHLTFVKPNGGTAMEIDSAPKSVNAAVSDFIQKYDPDSQGCTAEQIIYKFKDVYNEQEIRNAIEYLENEGQCYTTDNNEHIKSCYP
ncbi:hypothetical protein INT47_005872 [Mucor saturninus]|uniref:OB domain-containing protein n=1 Tax=Mucor saturninus TaxID=64648 RepID=A0A8H7R933_9FUNG|nr:hypothetical protein INT47_005872 [Mucor saturninus]